MGWDFILKLMTQKKMRNFYQRWKGRLYYIIKIGCYEQGIEYFAENKLYNFFSQMRQWTMINIACQYKRRLWPCSLGHDNLFLGGNMIPEKSLNYVIIHKWTDLIIIIN